MTAGFKVLCSYNGSCLEWQEAKQHRCRFEDRSSAGGPLLDLRWDWGGKGTNCESHGGDGTSELHLVCCCVKRVTEVE